MINRQMTAVRFPVKTDNHRTCNEFIKLTKHGSIVIYFELAVNCFLLASFYYWLGNKNVTKICHYCINSKINP
jgi:hypothetical protein